MSRLTPKILFIDDDPFFLEFYRTELSQYNISTEFATDGEVGIQKSKEIHPDVILLDVILPKKDGFQVVAELKSDPTTKDIPILIVSTLGSEKDEAELLKLGATRVFNKLSALPKDVATYVQDSIEKGVFVVSEELPASSGQGTSLSIDQIGAVFKDSLAEIDVSFEKLFNKKPKLDDLNVSLIPLSKFKAYMDEMAKEYGTIFIYSSIEAKEPGAVLLTMKRNAALSLIKLIQAGTIGKDIGLSMSDQVIEEFFNIVVNAFLTKLSKSIEGRLIMETPIITNPKSLMELVSQSKVAIKDRLVMFMEEAYRIEELDLSFSLFVTFGSGLFERKK